MFAAIIVVIVQLLLNIHKAFHDPASIWTTQTDSVLKEWQHLYPNC